MAPFAGLIPVQAFKSGFTTCHDIHLDNLQIVQLDDNTLSVHKVISRTPKKTVKPPPPSRKTVWKSDLPPPKIAWEAFYPKGSVNPSAPIPGGFGFYLSGPSAFAGNLAKGATEVVLSYRMMLQESWEAVKGGKLPGVFGGEGDLSYGCSGGRQDNRCKCFDLRPMWRRQNAGELYAYLPLTPENKKTLLAVPPLSIENSDFGFSVGRGAFKFDIAVGQWVGIAFRIKLNDIGKANGEVQLWVDGKSVILIKHLSLRFSTQAKIKGMHFQTFFGGHSEDWASPKDQRAWFSDITGVIIN